MSVNKVILMGRLGREPEVRTTQNGTSVVNLAVATSERYTDKQGQKQEKTEWHNVIFFNKQADTIAQYFHKGSPIYLEGKITTEKWQDKNGENRYTTKIIGIAFDFPPREVIQDNNQYNNQGNSQQQHQNQRQARPHDKPIGKGNQWQEPTSFDDDIPF